MATVVPNIVSTSNPVTRMRKKRDLETTMNTLKKLLEPTISVSNKKGSRKKNKPRSLRKKVTAALTKTINRIENNEDDGEYYPNKVKRNDNMKKIILKPKHELKVVVATNKRKRGTPHKGVESLEESPDLKLLTPSAELRVQTPPSANPDVAKYELISPPHKSLTELTIDDLIRMDEDSLSDEELMEILTCPSPVWWEDCPDDFKQGTLYLLKTAGNSQTETTPRIHTTEGVRQSDNNYNKNSTDIGISLKRSGPVSETKIKAKKIAKLENILGQIKSRVLTGDKPTNDSDERLKNDGKKADDDDNLDNDDDFHEMQENYDEENKILGTDGFDVSKRRTVSSSCSDISVNEEDLLRNLENIDIPMQKRNIDRNEDDLQNNVNEYDTNENDLSSEMGEVDGVDLKCDKVQQYSNKNIDRADRIKDSTEHNKSVETIMVSNEHKSTETVKLPERKNNQNDLRDASKEATGFKIRENKSSDLTNKDILKRLKTHSDDILDVRLIQTPTNISNEVKIWSKLDNFKRHNFKPEDFDNGVIDVEGELAFSTIQSVHNSPSKERDPLESKSETILIDDDSNDAFNENTKQKDIIDLDAVEIINDFTIHTEIKIDDSSLHSEMNTSKDTVKEAPVNDKDIINEDTIRIANVLDIRLIETTDLQNLMLNPKCKDKKQLGKVLKDSLRNYSNYSKRKSKNTELQGIRILPVEKLESVQQSPKTTNPTTPKQSKSNQRSIKCIKQSNEDSKNQNDDIIRVVDTTEKIIRLNDLNVLLVKNPEQKKDFQNSKILKKAVNPLKKDLSIPLVNKIKSDVKGVTILPLILPTLTNTPAKTTFESPKSVKSITSAECLEGTISDSNIQFLDEFEDDKSIEEEFINVESQRKLVDVENVGEIENKATDLDQTAEKKNTLDIDRENITRHDDFLKSEGNQNRADDLAEGNKRIEEEHLDDNGNNSSIAEEEDNKTILDGTDKIQHDDIDKIEENNSTTEELERDNKCNIEEYLDADFQIIAEGVTESSLKEANKNLQDDLDRYEENLRTGGLLEDNKYTDEEYLDDDNKCLAEEEAYTSILNLKNKSGQDDLVQNEENNSIRDLHEDNKHTEEEYLDDDSDNKSVPEEEPNNIILDKINKSEKDISYQYDGSGDLGDNKYIDNDKCIEEFKDNKCFEEEYLDDDGDSHSKVEEESNISILNGKNSIRPDVDQNEGYNSTGDLHEGNKCTEEEYLDDDADSNSKVEEESNISILKNASRPDLDQNEGYKSTGELHDDNKCTEEEYLDEDSDRSIDDVSNQG